METTSVDEDIALLEKFIFSEKAAKRITLFIFSIEQFEQGEEKSFPTFCDEEYIPIATLEPKIEFVLKQILPSEEYEDIVLDNIKKISEAVFNLIENSGFMRISFDENHYPEVKYDQLTSMAKLCVSFHYSLISSAKLLLDFTECIKLTEIENYINFFIIHFTGIDETMFYEPKVKSTTVLNVAKIIKESNLLNVDFSQ
ncbi:MAG: hypothetical protein H6609_17940 [Ignavibacteriales bacterium]|nr:hypothetical protein [Ignavibacteriales bacterium]